MMTPHHLFIEFIDPNKISLSYFDTFFVSFQSFLNWKTKMC